MLPPIACLLPLDREQSGITDDPAGIKRGAPRWRSLVCSAKSEYKQKRILKSPGIIVFVIPGLCDTARANAGRLPGNGVYSGHLFYGYFNHFFRPITFSFPVDAVD